LSDKHGFLHNVCLPTRQNRRLLTEEAGPVIFYYIRFCVILKISIRAANHMHGGANGGPYLKLWPLSFACILRCWYWTWPQYQILLQYLYATARCFVL